MGTPIYGFSLDGTSAASDPSSYDSGAGVGLYGVGTQYLDAYAPTVDAPAADASQTLGQLQSGGSGFDWTAASNALGNVLGTVVQLDSLNHGWPTLQSNTGAYKAPNGTVYPVGTGPATSQPVLAQNNGLMFMLLIGLVVFALAEEKK